MEPLQLTWFTLIAVLWTGYLVLEGFDFGVGMLTGLLPGGTAENKERERRVLVNSIGPFWDGNEVWLLTAGGATFAAFPGWYATMFSGFYLALLLILVALIARGVTFEWRGKFDHGPWRTLHDWLLRAGSWLPAVLWGVAFANLVRGVQLTYLCTTASQGACSDPAGMSLQYTGGFWALLNPFALLGGLTTLLVFLAHGAVFVCLKTDGDLRQRAHKLAVCLAVAVIPVAGAWALWAQLAYSVTWTWVATLVAAAGLLAALLCLLGKRPGWAFACNAVAIAAVVTLIFGSMYPYVLPGVGDGPGMTLAAAASTNYTLTVMTWVAAIFTPLVLLYQGWSFWVFKRRLTVADIPPSDGLPWRLRAPAM